MLENYKIENSNWSQRHIINLSIIFLIIALVGGAYFYKRYRDAQVPAPSLSLSLTSLFGMGRGVTSGLNQENKMFETLIQIDLD